MKKIDWKVGDIAICINNGKLPTSQGGMLPSLRLKGEYVVQNLKTCECGQQDIDVGLPLMINSEGVECHCGAKSSPKSGIHWCAAQRFTKKIVKTEKKYATVEEAVEAEDYEEAAKMRDKESR